MLRCDVMGSTASESFMFLSLLLLIFLPLLLLAMLVYAKVALLLLWLVVGVLFRDLKFKHRIIAETTTILVSDILLL